MLRWQYVFSLFFLLVLLLLPQEQARGDEFKLIPSLLLRQEYNDNVFFREGNKEDDFISTVSPGLELLERTERMEARVRGRLDGIFYADNTDLDHWDQHYRGTFRYQLVPRMGVAAFAVYSEDSRPDRDIGETGLVQGKETRERQNYGASTEFTLSEKMLAKLSYEYEDEDFDDPESDAVDNESHVASLLFTRDLKGFIPRTKGTMNFGYSRYEFPDADIDNYSLMVGASTELSELVSLLAGVGPRYTETDVEEDATGEKDHEEWGGTGQILLSYKSELTEGSLTFFRDLRKASGRRGTTERTALLGEIRRRFAYELQGRLLAEYFLNEADRGKLAGKDIDEETFRVRTLLRYNFTRDVALEASYSFTRIEDNDDDTDTNRNVVFIRLRLQYPLFD
jgi:opacity protein-like surface antigen